MLKDKTIILGVTGSIAAYKIAGLASMLIKQRADVHVIMTKNATNFVSPITFETITSNKCLVNTFDRGFSYDVHHVSLAKNADIIMIAPASANFIAKMAHGIADDMLTTTVLACKCKKIVAPAMNTNMYQNDFVQENIKKLKQNRVEVITPAIGRLACGDVGEGKMPSESILYSYIEHEIARLKTLKQKRVLVTAGATQERLDPVRYITNHSSGKMGYEIARECALRGAQVTLISGETHIEAPMFIKKIFVRTAKEMFNAVLKEYKNNDVIIKAAAVSDYRPINVSEEKLKKSELKTKIELEKTEDILAYLGEHKLKGQFICGFSMETKDLIENSYNKLYNKNVDMIVANNLKQQGAGFKLDTNVVTILTNNEKEELGLLSKKETASKIITKIENYIL